MYRYLICLGIVSSALSLSAMDGRKMWWAAVEKCENKTPQEYIKAGIEAERKAKREAEKRAAARRELKEMMRRKLTTYDPQLLVPATALAGVVRILLRKRY